MWKEMNCFYLTFVFNATNLSVHKNIFFVFWKIKMYDKMILTFDLKVPFKCSPRQSIHNHETKGLIFKLLLILGEGASNGRGVCIADSMYCKTQ